MGFYRALTNVQTLAGVTASPNDLVELTEAEAVQLAAIGGIDPVAVAGKTVLGPDDRLTALAGFIHGLTLADMSPAGALSPEGALRVEAALGFVPTDDELRAAAEAFMHSREQAMSVLGPLVRPPAPGGIQSSDPMMHLHGEAAAASPTTEAKVRAESSGLTVDERQAALRLAVAAFVPADYRSDGVLRAESRRQLHTKLGYEVSDDELRAAIEAAKAPPAA